MHRGLFASILIAAGAIGACGSDSDSGDPFGNGGAGDASTAGAGGGGAGGTSTGGSGGAGASSSGGASGSGAGGVGGTPGGAGGMAGSGGGGQGATDAGGSAGSGDGGTPDGTAPDASIPDASDAGAPTDASSPDVSDGAPQGDASDGAAASECLSLASCCATMPAGALKTSCEDQVSADDPAACSIFEAFFCGGGDGGADAGQSCSDLSTCCATLSGTDQTQCQQVVALGMDNYCAALLSAYQSGGSCN